MSHRHTSLLVAAILAAAAVALVSASTPVFWQVATRADLLKGDVENLSIDNDGRLSLGPPTSLLYDSAAPFLWALVPGADGSMLIGSGNEGKVFRVGTDGKSSTFYDASEMEIHALAPAPNGGLYAAASPDGQIYKVDANGVATAFFKPGTKYIWSLAVDPAGNVFAGTGEGGVIYKVTPDGKGSVFYKTRSTNVVALAFDAAGNLLAGTESPGRVVRIDREGHAFVLLESAYREIHSLRLDAQGVIYATAVAARAGGAGADERQLETPAPEPARAAPVPSVSAEITGITVIDIGTTAATEAKATGAKQALRNSKGAIYRILPDGLWDTVWESSDDTPYDVAIPADGSLLVATGNKGKIFRVEGDPPHVTLVGRAPAQQVTRFLTTPKGDVFYVTSNPGKLFRLSPGHADRGTYESEVRDTQTVSTWGTISWKGSTPAGAQIEIRTRSGNSQTPDDTWSAWSEPYRNPDGQQVQSPKARYLQWQATLSGKEKSPILTSVTAAYLQRNLRPRVTSITVYPAGHVFQKPYSTGEGEIAGFDDGWPDTRPSPTALAAGSPSNPSLGPSPLGRRIYQKGLQTFTWKGEDDNDDKLRYDLFYRREGDATWRPLKRGLTDPLFVWDTTSVPDGTYVVRIVASDSPSNPAALALAGEADSDVFDIDNTAPTIRVLGVRREGTRTLISFEAADLQSVIQRLDYSTDAMKWQPAYPKDGILDSRTEQFELALDGDTPWVVLRAMDAMGNVATIRADTTVRKAP
jgi:sugar lactone lactonase YvrE